MTTHRQIYKLRFFFDYGAGGCLWADNDIARQDFGVGPIDEIIAERTGKISGDTLKQIEELDDRHVDYYNKGYPPDPSLWRQTECEDFNQRVDSLLNSLRQELSDNFEIMDKQTRYSQDEDLEVYLRNPKGFRRQT